VNLAGGYCEIQSFTVTKFSLCETTAYILLNHIATFGCPNQILSDNGSQFVNSTISELLQLLGTEHQTSIAYSHQENAIVERSHKETLRHLRTILFDRYMEDKWSTCVPLVQRILNAKEHDSTKMSPYKILFGGNINLDRNIFVPDELSSSSAHPIDLSQYMTNLLANQTTINQLVDTTGKKIQRPVFKFQRLGPAKFKGG